MTGAKLRLFVLLLTASFLYSQTMKNLLANPSFEDDLRHTWRGGKSTMERHSDDKVHGQYSVLCKNRKSDIDGPAQNVQGLVVGGRYAFSGHVKLLDDQPGNVWQQFKVIIQFVFSDRSITNVKEASYIVAWRGFVTRSKGWISIIGDLTAPVIPFSHANLALRGPLTDSRFLADNFSLWEVPEIPNWEAVAKANIEKYRKSDIKFRVQLPPGVNRNEIDIEIDHKKHLFAFGSKVEDDLIRGKENDKFRSLFTYLFNWATVGSYKWRFDKGTPGDPDFSSAVEATNILLKLGLKVRAHSILWGVEENIPDWVLEVPPHNLSDILQSHVRYMINLTRGRVQQWDVQNEYLHGHYYEEKLQDPNVTKNIFLLAKSLNPQAKLYLNEYTCVTSGANTQDYHDLGIEFKNADTGIQGLGVQGHTKDFIKPDPTMMWRRLDKLSETGLELFMTEYDLGWPEENVRADWFEIALRTFFSHPGLSGVILWGFWNTRMRYPNQYLVYGENLQIAEPGRRWACLVKKEWSTHVTKNLSTSGLEFDVRGFQGDYQVIIKKNGVPTQSMNFSLGKLAAIIDIPVSANTDPINIPTERDYVPNCPYNKESTTVITSTHRVTSSTHKTTLCVWLFVLLFLCVRVTTGTLLRGADTTILDTWSRRHAYRYWTRGQEDMRIDTGHVVKKTRVSILDTWSRRHAYRYWTRGQEDTRIDTGHVVKKTCVSIRIMYTSDNTKDDQLYV